MPRCTMVISNMTTKPVAKRSATNDSRGGEERVAEVDTMNRGASREAEWCSSLRRDSAAGRSLLLPMNELPVRNTATYRLCRIFRSSFWAVKALDGNVKFFVSLPIMDGFYRHWRRHGLAILLLTASGCHQVVAPIHVWAPPQLQSAVGCKVAIAPIAGNQKLAGPLHTAMLAHAPRDQGRSFQCIDARSLQDNQTIRLVSATEGETSDIANLSLARRQGVDFLLTGEILPQSPAARTTQQHQESLAVSWKLVDVRGPTGSAGMPIVTQHDVAIDSAAIATAAAEDAWKLITPHVQSANVKLAKSRLALGSNRVNQGNAAAAAGDWMTASENWQRVLDAHPAQHAAMHNLAIAAVARQDYDEARRLIGLALQRSSKPLYRETAVWIEARQRDYHEAFGLPDPVEGWAATRRQPQL